MNFLKTADSTVFLKQNTVRKLHSITNAVTISNIASFETGEIPSDHGIIGHSFGVSSDTSIKQVSGFTQRFEKPSFWEQADQQGKQVLSIGALTMHGMYTDHAHVDLLAQGRQTGPGRLIELLPSGSDANSDLKKYVNSNSGKHTDTLMYYKIFTSQDREELVLDNDYSLNNGFIGKIAMGEWLEVTRGKTKGLQEAFSIKWLSTKQDTLRLYFRPAYVNRGYPLDFLEEVDTNIGPSKGWPNIGLYANSQISAVTLSEEINTETKYIMDAFSKMATEKSYDLIMIDYPLMDRLGHAFLNQYAQSTTIQSLYKEAFHRMDKDFQSIREFATWHGYELIITSGHGFSPVHTAIDLEAFLRRFHTTDRTWDIKGIPGKVSAHIYLNRQLEPERRELLENELEKMLYELKHNKEPVVDTVYKKVNLKRIGMDHENSGDLFVLLRPGFVFQNAGNGKHEIFGTSVFKGDHGYSLKYEESYGILISNMSCNTCHTIDVANAVKRQLGLR